VTAPRVIVITGASSGIGRATAHRLAQRGDHLVLIARALQPLRDTATECLERGAASAEAVSLDVRDSAAVDAALVAAQAKHGRIDAVVQSAGVAAYGRFEEVPAEVFEGVIRTNVFGAANVARSALPAMRAADHGTIVIIGSVIGSIAVPQMSAYAVSKWAMRSLARELSIENRDRKGVRICHVAPGGVDTPIYKAAANYQGVVGRPPPPVYSPERVAGIVVRALDRPRDRIDAGFLNPLMALGFATLPKLYDALVTPLFTVAASDDARVGPTTGNVDDADPQDLHELHGHQGSSAVAIAKALARRTGLVSTAR
jgi:short-subunit dehydrogenase